MSGISASRVRWMCRICLKSLSSKRSYEEHMNIHNRTRPFACEHCLYASASQMTLRRHKLRNHTPKNAWGYQCPHCFESYMEPASYQQHVQARHIDKSATFGCPHENCEFVTKCWRHFRVHFNKHMDHGGDVLECHTSMSRYLVADELGAGYNAPKSPKTSCKFPSPFKRTVMLKSESKTAILSPVIEIHEIPHCNNVQTGENVVFSESPLYSSSPDWIEAEIVVDGTGKKGQILPDGQLDLELD